MPKNISTTVTQTRVRELLNYDESSGVFTWKMTTNRRIKVGSIAGSISIKGYHVIRFDGHLHYSHRLAWLYVNGEIGLFEIDHIDGDRKNNRISNLRLASTAQNSMNRGEYKNNTSGLKGVYHDKQRGTWRALIRKDRKRYFLGDFSTPEAAHSKYLSVSKELFGRFVRSKTVGQSVTD